ncbi:MAG: hypothetical protein ACXVBH_04005 [Flavisolibacter sp.]
MKAIIGALLVLSLVSCAKENDTNSIVGSWRLTQITTVDTSTVYLQGTELSVDFKGDGRMEILGPKPNYTFLQDFNKYETLSNNRIRFFDSTSNNQLFATFRIDNTLSLLYEVRCAYEERFTRR